MNWLVTAGNTVTDIDRVRCITNIFSGRTGARIARQAAAQGHAVVLLTSHPEALAAEGSAPVHVSGSLTIERFRTFTDLADLMRQHLTTRRYEVVVHCAAVSDFEVAGVYASAPGTRFDAIAGSWSPDASGQAALVDRRAGKVKSSEPELWLRLLQTPKLIDQIREPWGFRGVLVKFKLEVGAADDRLLEIAERSRQQSDAHLMVANTLEGMGAWAYLGPLEGTYQRVPRALLAERLVLEVDRLAGFLRENGTLPAR